MRAYFSLIALAGLTLAGLPFLHGQDPGSNTPNADNPSPEGVQVLASGPVHEAYANLQQTRPAPTPVVPKPPPDPIQEMPPDQKPAGDNVQWIPGYWAWDDNAQDYIWVSGFWRNIPPGQQWAPGNWIQGDDGWRWVPGFWTSAENNDRQYLPEAPPASIDSGPSVPAPNDDSTYVPGCWIWNETRYDWRPGTWIDSQENYCYIPAHYLWTPNGYLFCNGFWDHPLLDRGLLFAPVRFTQALWQNADFSYVPDYCVQPDFLLGAMFTRPGYPGYVFGDFFADNFRRLGFRPWFDHHYGRYAQDPSFAFYAHHFGQAGWARNIQSLYQARYTGAVARPPRTLVQQNQVVRNLTVNKQGNTLVHQSLNMTHFQNAAPLTRLSQVKNVHVTALSGLHTPPGVRPVAGRTVRMETVSHSVRVEAQRRAVTVHQTAIQHRTIETRRIAPAPHPSVPRPSMPHPAAPGPRPIHPALRPPPSVHEDFRPAPRPQVHPLPAAVHTAPAPHPAPAVHPPAPHPAPAAHPPAPRIYNPPKPAPAFHAPAHVPPPPRPQPHPGPAPKPR
jgi:hypothetical protein